MWKQCIKMENNAELVDQVIEICQNIQWKYELTNEKFHNNLLANTKSNIDYETIIDILKENRRSGSTKIEKKDSNHSSGKIQKNLEKMNFDEEDRQNKSTIDEIQMSNEQVNFISKEIQKLLEEWNTFRTQKEKDNFLVEKLINKDLVSNEAKLEFIKQIIDTGQVDSLENGTIFNLIQEEDLLHQLVKTNKLEEIIEKNLLRVPESIVEVLSKLDADEFDKVFNSEKVKNCFAHMTYEEFKEVMKELREVPHAILNETILTKLVHFDTNVLNQYINSNAYEFMSIRPNENVSLSAYDKFIGEVLEKHYNKNYIFTYPEKIKYLEYLVSKLIKFAKDKNYNQGNIAQANQFIEQFKTIYNEKLSNSSNIKIDKNLFGENIIRVDTPGWYTFSIEINGEKRAFSIYTANNELELKKLNDIPDFQASILKDDAKINEFSYDERKSKLTFSNLKKGLNRFDIMIDGKLQSFVFKSSLLGTLELYERFKNAEKIGDITITPVSSLNCSVEKKDAVYKLTGRQNGKDVSFYLALQNAEQLDVDSVIEENNLYDLQNVQIQEVNLKDINMQFFDIMKYQSSQDVFKDDVYGGNQSDIYKWLKKDTFSSLEAFKVNDIKNIMRKYFPNITEVEVIELADNYGKCGCAFMSFSNALATYFGSLENGEEVFKQKFGYDLYYKKDHKKYYNVESIAMDCFLDYEALDTVRDTCIEAHGLNDVERIKVYRQFLEKKGIKIDSTPHIQKSSYTYGDLLGQLLRYERKENTFYLLNAHNFDLEYIKGNSIPLDDDAMASAFVQDKNCYQVGGHSMIITHVSAEGDIYVSSWGNEYKVKRDFLTKYKKAIATINPITFRIEK